MPYANNPVVIITGGTSGIGKALAIEFGKANFSVLITGRTEKRLISTNHELSALGIDVKHFKADVSNKEDNFSMRDYAIKTWGRIDILINNAGISMRAKFEHVKTDIIDKVMDINFRGSVYATSACIKDIIKQKGSVIGISSIAGYRGLPGRTGYSASKFALHGFLESLRTEMLPHGVHVLTACPGFTQSNIREAALDENGNPQQESPRQESSMMSSEKCAKHIFKAFKSKRKVIVLTRQGKLTVFLNKLLGGKIDKLVYNAMAKEKDAGFDPL